MRGPVGCQVSWGALCVLHNLLSRLRLHALDELGELSDILVRGWEVGAAPEIRPSTL